MNDSDYFTNQISMHITRGCLVVPIQVELTDEAALWVQRNILERTHTTGVKGVIIDLSGMNTVDTFLGNVLKNTAQMTALLGATMVITGLSPGVVASLVDLEVEFGEVQTVLTIEEGFQVLAPLTEPMGEEPLEEEGDDFPDENTEDNGEGVREPPE